MESNDIRFIPKILDKDSRFLLQLIDCNCNNCVFMDRDFETYNKWYKFHEDLAEKEFEAMKKQLLKEADIQDSNTIRNRVAKMTFMFDKTTLLQYGNCIKLSKPVSFIPDTCQPDTQVCFKHRKAE